MQIERGPGGGHSQALPGPGWAGQRPNTDDFRSYPSPGNKNQRNNNRNKQTLARKAEKQTKRPKHSWDE